MGHPFLAFTAPLVHPSICVIDDAATAGISTLRGPRNTTAARTESKHGSMAALHTAVCATQDGRMVVTRTNGSDKDDRRRRERRGRREWRRVCVCVRARVFACLHVCPIVRALDTRAARLVRPPNPGLPGTRATTAWPHCPRLCVDTWIEGYSLVGGVEMLLHASGKVHDSVSVTEAWPETTPAARDNKPSSAQGTARTKGMAPCAGACACAWACTCACACACACACRRGSMEVPEMNG